MCARARARVYLCVWQPKAPKVWFLEIFPELNREMFAANARISVPHHWATRFHQWIINEKGVLYWANDDLDTVGGPPAVCVCACAFVRVCICVCVCLETERESACVGVAWMCVRPRHCVTMCDCVFRFPPSD